MADRWWLGPLSIELPVSSLQPEWMLRFTAGGWWLVAASEARLGNITQLGGFFAEAG